MTTKLENDLASVILKVTEFFEDLDGHPIVWSEDASRLRKATKTADYICENNLVILLNWWGVVTEDWNHVKMSLRYENINEFDKLKMMMDNIITRMRLKILLNKMQDLL